MSEEEKVAQEFRCRGKGNGFPFCITDLSDIDSLIIGTTKVWDVCPEDFTLSELMNFFWNHDRFTFDNPLAIRYTRGSYVRDYGIFFDYETLGEHYSLPTEYVKSNSDLWRLSKKEPRERVCYSGFSWYLFRPYREPNYDNVWKGWIDDVWRFNILYDSVKSSEKGFDVYKLGYGTRELGTVGGGRLATLAAAEANPSAGIITDTSNLVLPVTPSKNATIPMAALAADRTSPGSSVFIIEPTITSDFYTYP